MLTKPLPGVMDDPSHPLSRGCVGHWLFNEGAGSLAYDVSGHGNHGILTNMLPNVQGSGWSGSKFGGGLAFDGSNDYVDCGNDPSLDITDAITIEAWVKSGDQTNHWNGISGKDSAYFQSLDSTEHLKCYVYQSGAWKYSLSSETLPQGQWKHVVMLYDSTGGNIRMFIDAVEVSYTTQETVTGTIDTSASNLYTGMFAYIDYSFNGSIDGVRVYNWALSAEEIKQLYHDPFCNLIQVPIWQRYMAVGLGIPVAMHHYEMLRA